jgi:hypothetical protein
MSYRSFSVPSQSRVAATNETLQIPCDDETATSDSWGFLIMKEGIVESLKNSEHDLRLINYKRWMLWNENNKEWEVYDRKNTNIGKLIIATKDEVEAIYNLLNE